ncbi:DUF4345 domain-containing protein [Streptomyces sp. NPDC088748]|uniref:DUF4345 domain-containing protein n=1 Tax=Streptomyces sp. NPDC088748 TaxID=3365887 RepID=UPI0038038720
MTPQQSPSDGAYHTEESRIAITRPQLEVLDKFTLGFRRHIIITALLLRQLSMNERITPLGPVSLRFLVGGLGLLAICLGGMVMLTGSTPFGTHESSNPTGESFFRYFATYYAGVGALFIWVAQRWNSENGQLLRALMTILFAGGVSRAICAAQLGETTTVLLAVTVFEVATPIISSLWHHRWLRAHYGEH